ncbi:MAG: co-chaperone GroES [Bacteroidetes bacterium]|nr:co-chaperone GroES [Bacteroidota bacterium]
MGFEVDTFEKFVVVGDRVLVKPRTTSNRTRSGLYLPPTVIEKESIQSGYVIKTGPGFPIPVATDGDEAWKGEKEKIKYIPLQAREGDLAIFLQSAAYDITFNDEKYLIVPHSSILMFIRDDDILD